MAIQTPTFELGTVLVTASEKRMTLQEWLVRFCSDVGRVIYIGTDSQQAAGVTKFTTAIVSHEPGHGGTYAFIRYKVPKIVSLRERLLAEAWRSVELAMLVSQKVAESLKIVVHLDVNESIKYKSGKYAGDLVALVVGQGFKAEIKPNAFAASSLADSLVKRY